jgi:predicted MFS family arabinose efflux permease
MMRLWDLFNSEAGWITASFYGAYMLSVPLLVTLTDRVDPKRVYLFGVASTVAGHLLFGLLAEGFWSALLLRALTGMGWAGTYMTGLKLLADRVDAKMMSRATAGHAASIGISGALSFATGDLIASLAGWQAAFLAAAASAAVAWVLIAVMVPTQNKPSTPTKDGQGLYDFRPVFRNSSAMAYAIAYCIHTLEMSALRGWGVAFLGYVAATTGAAAASVLSPAIIATGLGLIGTFASVAGNEAAIRYGRKRLIVTAMLASILIGATIGFLGSMSYAMAAVLLTIYGIIIWLDSSSLTAGTAGTAEPSRRGATLAVHSMLGYTGGFVGPLLVGWVLDLSGGMSQLGWGMSFLSVALLMALALVTFWAIRPRELEGDKVKAK